MEFRIREPGNGGVEIVQFQPVVVGSFPDRKMAEKVMAFLQEDALQSAVEAPRAPESAVKPACVIKTPAPDVKPLVSKQPAKHQTSMLQLPKFMPQPSKLMATGGVSAAQSDEEWTESDLDHAFERLARGEKLRDVADAFGKSWTKLRSKWASKKKEYSAEAAQKPAPKNTQLPALSGDTDTPLQKVTKAITELSEQQECNLCGRHFSMTPDSVDTCQRCQNGA